MFIRSKYERILDGRYLNSPINMHQCVHFEKDDKLRTGTPKIRFFSLRNNMIWYYNSKKERDDEYEWILRTISVQKKLED